MPSDNYYIVEFVCANESTDGLSNFMFEHNASGTEDTGAGFKAYFSGDTAIENVVSALETYRASLKNAGLDWNFTYEIQNKPNQDWLHEWKKGLQPLPVGNQLIVLAPWHEYVGNRIKIIIEPAMAFGTGHHATTMMCLEGIEALSLKMTKGSFLDIGTGSGILTICAAKLGFSPIYVTEIDQVAIDNAAKNFALNKNHDVNILNPELTNIKERFSLITCNLTLNGIKGLLDKILTLKHPDGYIILSGLMTAQESEIAESLKQKGLKNIKIIKHSSWASIIAI
ncbi:MAG: 50S ribosomal protein L11 methyltransferase [Candidatus Magnetoovum sp. WYHC-5]|nr:50S ribosomal protein L11 methyltransferase [Candidatus Magnetoovum sp. WYHC-5]